MDSACLAKRKIAPWTLRGQGHLTPENFLSYKGSHAKLCRNIKQCKRVKTIQGNAEHREERKTSTQRILSLLMGRSTRVWNRIITSP